MKYNWEMNFSILLTLILTILSLITHIITRIKNSKERKIDLYEIIYLKAITLINYPIKKRDTFIYYNKNEVIQKIVRRKINDFINEVDTYWSYYNKPISPELEKFTKEKRTKYEHFAEREFNKYLISKNENYNPLSPAFYYDDELCKESLDSIIKQCFIKKSKLPKKLNIIIERVIINPPEIVLEKYKAQLAHDSEYFQHNEVMFDDPYRELVFNIKYEYEKLTTSLINRLYNKIYEVILRAKYRYSKSS